MAYERVHKSFGQSSPKKKHTPIVLPLIEQQTPAESQLSPKVKPSRIPSKEEREAIKRKIFDSIRRSGENQAMREGLFSPTVPVQKTPDSASKIGMPIQPKLTIGAPGDKYEQEADRVAFQVVNQINAPVAQQSSQNLQREKMSSREELMMKPDTVNIQCEAMLEEEELQRSPKLQLQAGNGGMTATAELESSIQQARSGGQPLADNVIKPMERAFGADFSRVKVHTDTQADQLNQSIQARAFTMGQDVFFSSGEYNPGSRGGQELIAHELTHVVQQNGGAVQRSLQTSILSPQTFGLSLQPKLTIGEPGDHYEQKADRVASPYQGINTTSSAAESIQRQNDSGGAQTTKVLESSMNRVRRVGKDKRKASTQDFPLQKMQDIHGGIPVIQRALDGVEVKVGDKIQDESGLEYKITGVTGDSVVAVGITNEDKIEFTKGGWDDEYTKIATVGGGEDEKSSEEVGSEVGKIPEKKEPIIASLEEKMEGKDRGSEVNPYMVEFTYDLPNGLGTLEWVDEQQYATANGWMSKNINFTLEQSEYLGGDKLISAHAIIAIKDVNGVIRINPHFTMRDTEKQNARQEAERKRATGQKGYEKVRKTKQERDAEADDAKYSKQIGLKSIREDKGGEASLLKTKEISQLPFTEEWIKGIAEAAINAAMSLKKEGVKYEIGTRTKEFVGNK